MDPDGPLLYILFFLLLFLSAFFSASETAFSSCNQIKLRVKADNKSKSAKLALKLIDKFDNSLITILIGNNVVNILASTIATVIGIFLFKGNTSLGTLMATIFTTIVVLIFGEIIPKNIASVWADRMAMLCAYPIFAMKILLFPISIIYTGLLKLLDKILKVDKKEPLITEDEFSDIIDSIEEEGLIEEEESDIIQSAVDFGDITVKEIYTKKENMVMLDIKTNPKDIINFLLEIDYSRIPVYSHNENHIIGILHVRRYLKQVMTYNDYSLRKNLVRPYFVSLDMKIDDVFEEFRKKKTHIAIVSDKNKNAIGMLTMDDVLEELVGEMGDYTTIIPKKSGDSKWLLLLSV